ncbi:MAG: ATP-dependent DNA helicase RecG [Candidatus Levybacteria bacterium]|nr:ATP-dependent DNA helicase RecG [Candidatus Levybacteria bacterium]
MQKLDLYTFRDLLYHIPSRYEDFSLVSEIGKAQEGEIVTIKGQILEAKNEYTRSRKAIQKMIIADQTGSIALTWFNQPYIIKSVALNDSISVSGKVERFKNNLTMISPDYELASNNLIHTGRIIPIYPETAGVSSKWLRRQIALLLEEHQNMTDPLPETIKNEYGLLDLSFSLKEIHFPSSFDSVEKARHRLAFDEVFYMQLAGIERKKLWHSNKTARKLTISEKDLKAFVISLPFTLTDSQKQAVNDLTSDLSKEKPMNRLLQGDVGSGKTVIAAIGAYITAKNGLQSAIMAPTEILAKQHFATLDILLKPFEIKVGIVTSSEKMKKEDSYDVLVGTHALVSKSVVFKKLGFVVIDEQQRFGVSQRFILREKGVNPHVFTMTATPIPRTMMLTLYRELDASYLTHMPKGRKTIKTWLVSEEKRQNAYSWIEKQIQTTKSQVFIICPFIEISETMQTVKSAVKEFETLQEIFPKMKMGLLHGKLKAKEKDEALKNFRDKKYQILVATPVVEVGIDIPNATIIVIEGSERFGLAQLHQLRGRVGRGEKQSYCLLFSDAKNQKALSRLRAMENMQNGAELAEFDLTLRGPGDIFGTKQSGVRILKIASFSDFDLLQKAKNAAQSIEKTLDDFPELSKEVKSFVITPSSPD